MSTNIELNHLLYNQPQHLSDLSSSYRVGEGFEEEHQKDTSDANCQYTHPTNHDTDVANTSEGDITVKSYQQGISLGDWTDADSHVEDSFTLIQKYYHIPIELDL